MGGEWVIVTALDGARLYWLSFATGSTKWTHERDEATLFQLEKAAKDMADVIRSGTPHPVTVEPWLPF